MNNIWTQFKNELGYVTASIQYTELALRISKGEHASELDSSSIEKTAKRYNLSVSAIPEDFGTRIVGNYIIQVHCCVDEFLHNFKKLVGSPTHELSYDEEEDNYLHWTMKIALGDRSKEYTEYYRICNYYRLLRNEITHYDGKKEASLKAAFSLIQKTGEQKLQAPNPLESICFDDQVLFARSARKLLEAIYFQSRYDWNAIVLKHKEDIGSIIASSKHDPEKTKRKVENYLKRLYPVPPVGIEDIVSLL